ncbi:MAG: hypothetical protein AAGD96_34910 [Chloroflexota bacterium]
MKDSKIPRWIIYYGVLNALATLGFGIMFYINSNPTIQNDLSWFAGGRNMAIFAVFVVALVRLDVNLLFAGFLLRFIVDFGDMLNSFIAGEIVAGLSFIPLFTIPQAICVWLLWRMMTEKDLEPAT